MTARQSVRSITTPAAGSSNSPTRSAFRRAPGRGTAPFCQRLTIIGLFNEPLVEEGVRPENPGAHASARGAARRAIIQPQRRLPWIPSEDDWRAIVSAARDEPLRNRLMLA